VTDFITEKERVRLLLPESVRKCVIDRDVETVMRWVSEADVVRAPDCVRDIDVDCVRLLLSLNVIERLAVTLDEAVIDVTVDML